MRELRKKEEVSIPEKKKIEERENIKVIKKMYTIVLQCHSTYRMAL